MDDYNLIYSQNKNKSFLQKFDSISFENSTFSLFTNTTQNQSQPTIQNNLNTIPKLIYNQNKTLFIHIWGFPQLKHKNKGVWVYFLPQPLQIFSSKLFDLLGARDGKQTQPKLDLLKNPSFSLFSPLFFSQKWDFLKLALRPPFWPLYHSFKCKAMFGLPHLVLFLIFLLFGF